MKTPFHTSKICRFLAVTTGLLLATAGANAQVVFQADYNGSGGGTGGASDMVTVGGTGSGLVSNPSFTSTVQSSSPLVAGSGGYLNATWAAAGGSGYFATYTPASAASSLASWVGTPIVNGANTYENLNGGFDMFSRLNVQDSSNARSANWLCGFANISTISGSQGMGLTFSGLGYGAIRLQLNTGAAAGIVNYTKITSGNGSASFASGNAAYGDGVSDFFDNPGLYHLGFTFSTDANGLITEKVFAATGAGAIDTTSSANLQYEATFNLDATALGANPISSGAWHQAGYSGAAGTSADTDLMRVYGSDPTSFSALVTSVPEPSSFAMAMIGLGSMGFLAMFRMRSAKAL